MGMGDFSASSAAFQGASLAPSELASLRCPTIDDPPWTPLGTGGDPVRKSAANKSPDDAVSRANSTKQRKHSRCFDRWLLGAAHQSLIPAVFWAFLPSKNSSQLPSLPARHASCSTACALLPG